MLSATIQLTTENEMPSGCFPKKLIDKRSFLGSQRTK